MNPLRLRPLLAALVLFLAAAVALGAAVLGATLPKTAGEFTLPGLERPIVVARDRHGVPAIRGETADDAAFGLGLAHAQDRFFQMELMRRAGAGRLSEMLGVATLSTDRFMRRLGLYRLAEAEAETAPPELTARLAAYAAGVNAWIRQAGWPWTPEFLLLGHAPEPWRPADSLVWGKLMAVQLGNNWRTERLRLDLLQRLSPEQVDFLWPPYPGDAPTVFPDRIPGRSGLAGMPGMPQIDWDWDPRSHGAPGTASNAWATREAGRGATVANDPHLEFRAPVLWYLARLEWPGGLLAGATVPGVPFLVVGHNGHVGWGFTTTGADTEDLIVESASGLQEREERVPIKGGEPEILTVQETPEGPVIDHAGGLPLTLSAPYLEPGDTTAQALLALNGARSAAEVEAALRLFRAPVQNVFYATGAGDYGFRTAGAVPVRKRGDGRVPLVRAQGPVGRAGFIPFEAMPALRNPPGGAVMNANNKVVGPDYPHLITHDWEAPFRARRLSALLAEGAGDPAILMDIVSEGALALLPAALAQLPEAERPALAKALAAWDGAMDRGRREPLAYVLFALELKRAIFADELGDAYTRWHGLRVRAVLRALTEGPHWCDDGATADRRETCADAVRNALAATEIRLKEIDARLGRAALWGDAHKARFEHPLFSKVPLLDRLTTLEIATDGGNDTLNRGAMWLGMADRPLAHRHGAGLRAILPLAAPDAAAFIIATGQSGNPLSPHYGDQLETWRDGGTLTLGPAAKDARILKLLPK